MPRLLSINNYHYRRGGADAVYLDHAALMERLGWENAFFSMHFPANEPCRWSNYFVDEIQIGHRYSPLQKAVKATKVVYSFEARRKLRRLLREYRPDVAHVHNIYHHISPSILPVLRQEKVPVVMTAHDLKIACPNNKMLTGDGVCERCKGGRYREAVAHRCIHGSLAASTIIAFESYLHAWLRSYERAVDRIVVPSRFLVSKLVEWGWPESMFTYVPNFVDAASYVPDFRAGDYLLYFGRLSVEKGVETLIRAAAAARVPVRIAGTGPIERRLADLAARVEAPVRFEGYRSGRELHDLIRGCRATVLPSEWYENAPISILESFALGKPVLGADIGGIPEIVRPGETGWLFESGSVASLAARLDEICTLGPEAVEALGRQARSRVETAFSPARYVRAISAVYASLGVARAGEARLGARA